MSIGERNGTLDMTMASSLPPRSDHPRAGGTAVQYDAFISYSHAVDGKLAPALQLGLHRFGKPWYRLRALRVFRDEASLAADPGLWSAIQAALDRSRFFILLASPEAAQSKWVTREIEFWCTHRSPSNLLIALTDGLIAWDEARNDFDWVETTAVPVTLRQWISEEPRWIDLRWAHHDEDVSPRHPRFRESIAELAAPIHGRSKDELVGEDVRQHGRALRLARLAVTALVTLLVVAVLAAVVAVRQRDTVRRERDLTASRLLATQAEAALDDRLDRSLLLSLEALRTGAFSEGRSSLLTALNRGARLQSFLRPPAVEASSATPRRIEGITDAGSRAGFVAFTPDGKTLLASSRDGSVSFWDVARGTESALPLRNDGFSIYSFALSPDGRTLALGGQGTRESDEILLWDLPSRQRIGEPLNAPGEAASSLLFSPDGKRLASWGPFGSVGLWDMSNRSLTAQIGKAAISATVSFSADGRTLAVASGNSETQDVFFWDVEGAAFIGTPLSVEESIDALAFSPNGAMLAIGAGDGRVVLWDIHNRQPMGQPMSASDAVDISLQFSPDNRMLAVAGSDDGAITLWDTASQQRLGVPLRGHDRVVTGLAFSTDSNALASAGVDGAVILWDIRRQTTLGRTIPTGRDTLISATAVSSSGLVASGDARGRIAVRELATGALRFTLEAKEWVWSIAFSPDGRLLAAGLDGRGGPIRLWDSHTGEPVGDPLIGHTGTPKIRHEGSIGTLISFTPDGRRLVSGGVDGALIVWDVEKRIQLGARLGTHDAAVTSLAVSPKGTIVASGDQGGTAVLSHLGDGFSREDTSQVHGGWVTSMSFSPDGKWLASGGEDGSILVRPVGRPVEESTRLGGHESDVRSLTFSPNGEFLVSGGGDGAIIIWDSNGRRQVGEPLTGHQERVWALAFSPDGRSLVSGGDGGVLLVWDTDVSSWKERACQMANRSFTEEEWDQLVGETRPYHRTCPDRPPR